MPRSLQDELKQTKPFVSLEQEAQLSIERTAAVLGHATAELLKPFGITPTQYNVLRVLRGAGEEGLCRNEVGERLVARMPDATRLLDRLEDMGLVVRRRSAEDRRYVTARITEEGLRLLKRLDGPMIEGHRRLLGHMSEQELRALSSLLAKARQSE